jgi:hypothetical protein
MKVRFFLSLTLVLAIVLFWTRRAAGQRPLGLGPERARTLRDALSGAYQATLAAFDPDGESEAAFAERDARAAEAADELKKRVEEVGLSVPSSFARALEAFSQNVADAQLQIMAFAINRKNRNPDSAQAEMETADRRAFKDEAEQAYSKLIAALH